MSDEIKDTPEITPLDLGSFIKEKQQIKIIILSDSHLEVTYKKIAQIDLLEGVEDTFVLPLPTKDSDTQLEDTTSEAENTKKPQRMTKKETVQYIEYLKTICILGCISPILLENKKDLKKANQLPIDYLDITDIGQLGWAILNFSGLNPKGFL